MIDRWLLRPSTAEHLAALRIGLFAVVLVRVLATDWRGLADDALLQPLGVAHVWSLVPHTALVVLALEAVVAVACVLAVVGVGARVAMPLAWCGFLLLSGLHTSQGKLMHNDVLLLVAALPVALGPAADAWVWRRRDAAPAEPRGTPTAYGFWTNLSIASVALVYGLAGLQKLRHSGPEWVFSDNLRNVLLGSTNGRDPGSIAHDLADAPSWALRTVAAATLLFELSFLLLLSHRIRRWGAFWALGAAGMHAGIGAAMGLDYTRWIAVDLIVLVPWATAFAVRFPAAGDGETDGRRRGRATRAPAARAPAVRPPTG
ncbi:hypothetical protein DSM112329_01067 [Paraconexibacter sp. AEG42_29]|uniref:HTTM-like domain-containing protein n=1 Tax=Paraconexibacter sp. AEG42_29 TaxID=2997339 RepID=A0AAU7ARW9_9ACTN